MVIFNLSIKIVNNLSFKSNSDEAILEANSSPSTGLSCQEKTTPSKKSIRTRRLWDKVSLFVTKNTNFFNLGRGRQSHNWY